MTKPGADPGHHQQEQPGAQDHAAVCAHLWLLCVLSGVCEGAGVGAAAVRQAQAAELLAWVGSWQLPRAPLVSLV
jgi:hypothetical protein